MDNTTKISTLDRFYFNLMDLVEIIREIVPNNDNNINPTTLELIYAYIKGWGKLEKNHALENFIKSTHPFWDTQIYNREINFFTQNKLKLFPQFKDYLNKINQIISNSNQETLDTIWEYIHVFIKQSIKFIHENRKPTHVLHQNQYKKVYSESYMDKISISNHAKRWKLTLEWE